MSAARKDFEECLEQLHMAWWTQEQGMAQAWVDADDQEAWYKNFFDCLAKIKQGPSPKPAATGSSGAEVSGAEVKAVKRRRVDDGSTPDDHEQKVFETQGHAAYMFTGPADFSVEAEQNCPAYLVLNGHATLSIEKAAKVTKQITEAFSLT